MSESEPGRDDFFIGEEGEAPADGVIPQSPDKDFNLSTEGDSDSNLPAPPPPPLEEKSVAPPSAAETSLPPGSLAPEPEAEDHDSDFRSIADLIDEELVEAPSSPGSGAPTTPLHPATMPVQSPPPTPQVAKPAPPPIPKSPSEVAATAGVPKKTPTSIPMPAAYASKLKSQKPAKVTGKSVPGAAQIQLQPNIPASAPAAAPAPGSFVALTALRQLAMPDGDFGEGTQVVSQAVNEFNEINAALGPYLGLQEIPPEVGQVADILRQYQTILKDQQNVLQDLVSSYIRQGDFERMGAVDKIKRHLSDSVGQIRSLLNRFVGDPIAPAIDAKLVAQLRSQQSLAAKEITDIKKIYRQAKTDDRTAQEARTTAAKKAGPGQSSGKVGLIIKFVLIALIFGSVFPAYYFSKNFGVQSVKKLDVSAYTSILPLESANASGTSFQGVVSDSWHLLDKKQREQNLRDLAKAIKSGEYQTIFLVYPSRGIAAIYSIKADKVHIQ